MADDLIFETMEERGGGSLTGALETLHMAALDGFDTAVDIGGGTVRWPVLTGLDLLGMVALRDSLERVVLPALNAGIAGRPGPFDGSVDGDLDPALAIVATAAVT